MRKPLVGTIAGFVGVALVLTGCSSSSQHAVPSTAPTSAAPTTTTTSTTKTAVTSTSRPRNAATDLTAVRLRLEPVVTGLSIPVAIAFRGATKGRAGTMYVAEKTGTLRRIVNGRPSGIALDLRANLSHGGEQGFLGIAFSPDGNRLYVDYTDANGDSNVDEYTMKGDGADASTRRRVLFVDQPYPNHNGGEVVFGPDGELYIGFGDGGSAGDPQNHGQDLGTPLGKILRIDPKRAANASYSIPADNPFVGRPGVFAENWMFGLRNPWRFSFDRATGDLWIGDVGQGEYEEIDYARRGEAGINWGWSRREGDHEYKGARPAGARDPIVETTHSDGWCAIVGGYVYRGRAIPKLVGTYLYGDNCRSNIEGAVQRGGRVVAGRDLGIAVDSLTTFGEDRAGEVYLAARSGTIYKLAGS
jgi:glucose/arabinose dehydrogenase